MKRRSFLKVVSATGMMIAMNPSSISQVLMADDGRLYKSYARVQLLNDEGLPLTEAMLEASENYVFNYPYAGTTTLLINLPNESAKDVSLKDEFGQKYVWKGGVGSRRTIVAYSGICPHQLTHINKNDSFISYRKKGERFEGHVVCDGHTSVYDPKHGCKVMKGKAAQPMASIVLEVGDDNTLYAVGVLGPDKYHEFFKSFRRELKEQFGSKRNAKKEVESTAVAMRLSAYTQEVIQL